MKAKTIKNKSKNIEIKVAKNKVNNNFGKTDYKIPSFSFKSSFLIILSGVLGTIVVPYVLSIIGIDFKIGAILGNATVTSFGLVYCRYFIESKEGFCKSFWITYGGFSVALALITFFWMYLNIYI